jgi:hypothetical protein
MARAAATSTTLPTITIRPENPAAEIANSIERTVAGLQDIAKAAALMKRDLKTEYPHGRVARAQVATLYAALINEVARVSGDLIGDVIRLGDDVLGVLTDRERRDSYTVVRDVVGDDWAAAFAGFAEREYDDEDGGYTTTEEWQRHIVDTVRAMQARRAAA